MVRCFERTFLRATAEVSIYILAAVTWTTHWVGLVHSVLIQAGLSKSGTAQVGNLGLLALSTVLLCCTIQQLNKPDCLVKSSSTLPSSVGQIFFSSVSKASFTRQRSFLGQTPWLMAMLSPLRGQSITTSQGIAFSLGSAYLSPSGGGTKTVPGTGSVLDNQTNQEVSHIE